MRSGEASGRAGAGTGDVRERPAVRRGASSTFAWDDDVREGGELQGAADVSAGSVREGVGEGIGSAGAESADEGYSSGTSSNSDWEGPPTTPKEDFVAEMILLYLSRALNARQFCTLMWHSGRSGNELAAHYGLNPEASSGHFNRHCRKVMPELEERRKLLYTLSMAGSSTRATGRVVHDLQVFVPHEMVDEDLRLREGLFSADLHDAIDSNAVSRRYNQHPLIVGQPPGSAPVAPFDLFVDGVAYSLTDSVIGFWLINQITGKRILFCVVRKKILCSCGCKGWCSMYPVLAFIRWSLEALANGRFPPSRHDGKSFGEDGRREGLAGTAMAYKGALIFIKADWAELVTSFGFPAWNDSIRACPFCNCTLENMYDIEDGVTLEELEWRPNGPGDYNAACARCEVKVVLDRASHALVESLLAVVPLKGSLLLQDIPPAAT